MQQTQERHNRVKFATQANPELLESLRRIAATEGRQIQALVEEALSEYVERKQGNTPRKHVLQALKASMDTYDSLYKELAK